ncbi:diacylglycerol/polyprenol kinase family protein [Leptolyngbya sp. FACHB-261]|uniref:diacylglycerol/polyprenol kinase family protein n=1 Tax=Leptolyngbya sp. FACHB-261 TaxID=2692806 RepID=UPI00168A3B9A|nr:diacylglycerol/polyprenol kinase family protein [Leptolyngbya sp. FACHB-261]MBD2103919.1 phosphatidate cytidylyltransferase [Leptolyngbya sp. FACHB-261]
MMASDWFGLAASYIYSAALLAVGELLRKLVGLQPRFTRKIIHIGAGMWVFGVLALFQHWQLGILPFATFIGLNYLFYRYRLISAMDSEDSSPGTVYFALSVTLLFGLLWRPAGPIDQAPIATAGVMAMTWGDALAALIGRSYGRHRYQVGQSERSWEGSAAMFISSAVAMAWVLLALPGSALCPLAIPVETGRVLLAALLGASAATLVEAVSPHGTDNLSVPLVAAGVVWVVISRGA